MSSLALRPGRRPSSGTDLSAADLAHWCQQSPPDDHRAFEALMARYAGRVRSTAYRLTGNWQDAEDLAQEVFLRVYREIGSLRNPATLEGWLFRIATNLCYDELHRLRRTSTLTLQLFDDSQASEQCLADTWQPTPEDRVLCQELGNCLALALSDLDPDARAVLLLRDLEDRPYQEIADLLLIGLSALKMRIHRARQSFRLAFDRRWPGVHELW